jgi:hypothetical protein
MEGARKGAGLISAFTVDVQNQLTVFADSRLKIDQLRLDNINGLEENAIDTAQRNSIEIDIWRMKHLGSKTTDHRILFFEAIRASTEEAAKQQLEQEQLRAERARAIQAMKSAINFDAAKLAKVSKNLADLAKTENFKAQANFLIEFVGEVRKSIRELEEDAEKQVEKAENEASETTNEQDNTSGT